MFLGSLGLCYKFNHQQTKQWTRIQIEGMYVHTHSLSLETQIGTDSNPNRNPNPKCYTINPNLLPSQIPTPTLTF